MKQNDFSIKVFGFTNFKTYLFSILFIAGNIIFPSICHIIPNGGLIFLPIYFFTLLASYKYGLKIGLLTAFFSPIVNFLILGLPTVQLLPIILLKSLSLAFIAWFVAYKTKKLSIMLLALVVISYQSIGFLLEVLIFSELKIAALNLLYSIPGMFLQVFLIYFIIKKICK